MDRDNDPASVNPAALNGFAEAVARRVTGGGSTHVVTLLPEDATTKPDPPAVWKDEEALGEWKRSLPDRDTAVVLRVVYASAEEFENEVRFPDPTP